MSRLALGPTQPSVWGYRGSYPGLKRLGHEVYYWCPPVGNILIYECSDSLIMALYGRKHIFFNKKTTRDMLHTVFVGVICKIWSHIYPGLVLHPFVVCLVGNTSCLCTQLLNLYSLNLHMLKLNVTSFISLWISVRQRGAEWSVLLTQYCAGGQIETNEMGRACGAYGGG